MEWFKRLVLFVLLHSFSAIGAEADVRASDWAKILQPSFLNSDVISKNHFKAKAGLNPDADSDLCEPPVTGTPIQTPFGTWDLEEVSLEATHALLKFVNYEPSILPKTVIFLWIEGSTSRPHQVLPVFGSYHDISMARVSVTGQVAFIENQGANVKLVYCVPTLLPTGAIYYPCLGTPHSPPTAHTYMPSSHGPHVNGVEWILDDLYFSIADPSGGSTELRVWNSWNHSLTRSYTHLSPFYSLALRGSTGLHYVNLVETERNATFGGYSYWHANLPMPIQYHTEQRPPFIGSLSLAKVFQIGSEAHAFYVTPEPGYTGFSPPPNWGTDLKWAISTNQFSQPTPIGPQGDGLVVESLDLSWGVNNKMLMAVGNHDGAGGGHISLYQSSATSAVPDHYIGDIFDQQGRRLTVEKVSGARILISNPSEQYRFSIYDCSGL